jgi:hypothetical protein
MVGRVPTLRLGVPIESLLVPVRSLHRVRTTREEVLANVAGQLDSSAELERLLGEQTVFSLSKLQDATTRLRGANRPTDAATLARGALGLGEDDLIRDVCGLL